ncbi:MAG: hypothetical protein AB7E42_06000 [Anaerotignaceae bacterium]
MDERGRYYDEFNEYCQFNGLKYDVYYDDEDDEVSVLNGHKKVSSCFIEITAIYSLKNNYIVSFQFDIDANFDAELFQIGNIFVSKDTFRFNFTEYNLVTSFIKTISKDSINDIHTLKTITKHYITFIIENRLSNFSRRCKIGWDVDITDSIIFSGVTHRCQGSLNPLNSTLFEIKSYEFNKIVRDCDLYKVADSDYCNGTSSKNEKKDLMNQSLEIIMPILQKNPDLCILLSYDILALTYRFLNTNLFEERLPLCICGINNKISPKVVANIFCNMHSFDAKRANTINKKTSIDYNSVFNNLSDYYLYSDITFLIEDKLGFNKRKNNDLVKIIRDTIEDNINYFPVFVTSNDVSKSEFITVDISNIKDFPNSTKINEITDLKIAINRLLLEFILFIYTLSNDIYWRSGFNETENFIERTAGELLRSFSALDNLDSNIENQYLLYLNAMAYFFVFLNQNELTGFSKKLEKLCFEVFKARATHSINIPLSKDMVLENFNAYVVSIFIDKTIVPDYFYFEGIEKRGEREHCYYLEYNKFYSHFLKEKPIISRSEKDFLHILKDYELIKTKGNVSYGVERKFEGMGKKIYVLAVLKEKINIF